MNYQVPHAINSISKEAKRVYPYAISLMESVQERDIDLLLLEEFHASIPFQQWFIQRTLGPEVTVGTFLGALLFGALLTGTSTRHLNADIFRPDLAGNLTQIIQGLIVLFVGADVLILTVWNARKRLRVRRSTA